MNKWSISSRTILLGLTPAFFMFVLLTGYYIHDKFNVLQDQLTHKGDLLVQQLAPASEYAVFIKNPSLLEDIVSPILDDNDVAYVEIYDRDGELLLARKDLSLLSNNNKDNIIRFSSKITLQDVPLESNDFDIGLDESINEPESNVIGTIILALSTSQVIKEQNDALVGGIIIGLGALLLSTLLALFIARTIAKPIQTLSKTVKLFQSGMLSARVDERSGGELGVLESNLNKMASTLESSKRRELEHAMALEQARAEALSASRAKSEFLEQMSHELREPMNATIGSLQLLESCSPNDSQLQYIVQGISSSALLVELIDNILDYSQIEVESIVLQNIRFDLKRLFRRSLVPFISACNKKNIDSHLFFDGLDNEVIVEADQVHLQKIIYHILDCSIRRTENGSIDIRVAGELPADNNESSLLHVTIEITDTGIGFSSEQLGNLFKSHSEKHDLNQPYKPNSGLGLTIAHKLTILLGGKFNVTSVPNKGTRFLIEFDFPFFQPQRNNSDAKNKPMETPSYSGNILVIESSSIDQMVTKDMLNKIGAEVETATNGKIALEKMRQQDFQLIIADTNITDISIIDLIQRLRALERAKNTKISILILTADIVTENHRRLQAAGADDYIIKPVDMHLLWDKVIQLSNSLRPTIES
ncbi:ATP-binding protein [Pleionea sediminis]|uniref:ATP-binding protein n=1 Tax=Pleionea sediminis TaxID=2569479 RepID=UPI0013DE6CC5|nr:ATP-binding protein [Pleionea sediminis]